jgi:hypothetical protein
MGRVPLAVLVGIVSGFVGAAVAVVGSVYLVDIAPPPAPVDLDPLVAEIGQLRAENAELRRVVERMQAADEAARQAERDEVNEALRLRDQNMGRMGR